MKIIGISDCRGNTDNLKKLKEVIDDGDFDLLVFSGGISGGQEHSEEYEEALRENREPVKDKDVLLEERERKKRDMENFVGFLKSLDIKTVLIPGSQDCPWKMYNDIVLTAVKDDSGIHFVHLKFSQIKRVIFSGCGGWLRDRDEDFFRCEVSKQRMKNSLQNLKSFSQDKILLSYTPPASVDDENGSEDLDEIIETVDPKILFYGHLDPDVKMRVIGDTVTICPGPFSEGNYVTLNTVTMSVDFYNLED